MTYEERDFYIWLDIYVLVLLVSLWAIVTIWIWIRDFAVWVCRIRIVMPGNDATALPSPSSFTDTTFDRATSSSWEEVFQVWAANRIVIQENAIMAASDAYDDFCASCTAAQVQPCQQTPFGRKLKAFLEAQSFKVAYGKTNGAMAYRGACLANAVPSATSGNDGHVPVIEPIIDAA